MKKETKLILESLYELYLVGTPNMDFHRENLACGNLHDIYNYIEGYNRGHKDGRVDFSNSIKVKK